MDERGIIAAAAGLDKVGGGVVVGIGDDAAVLEMAAGYTLLTADMLVEGTHFTQAWASAADVGWKSLAVNVSDIAAMGGTPRHAVVSLALPPGLADAWVRGFYEGLGEACRHWRTALVGGDTVKGPAIIISISLLGAVQTPRLRQGAQPGWVLAVTGALGGAAAGLWALQLGHEATSEQLGRWRRPEARLEAGQALAALPIPLALTDCSDGLVRSIELLTEGWGYEVQASALPIDPIAAALAGGRADLVQDWALVGGEEYELVLALPEDCLDAAREAVRPLPLSVVGRVTLGDGGWLLEAGGRRRLGGHWGFRHF